MWLWNCRSSTLFPRPSGEGEREGEIERERREGEKDYYNIDGHLSCVELTSEWVVEGLFVYLMYY